MEAIIAVLGGIIVGCLIYHGFSVQNYLLLIAQEREFVAKVKLDLERERAIANYIREKSDKAHRALRAIVLEHGELDSEHPDNNGVPNRRLIVAGENCPLLCEWNSDLMGYSPIRLHCQGSSTRVAPDGTVRTEVVTFSCPDNSVSALERVKQRNRPSVSC